MDKTKRGIALFITLLVIASIFSIVAVSFSYLEKVKDDASEVSALIQGNLFYKNTTDILKQLFPKGRDNSAKLKLIYNIPFMLSEKESNFNINLHCKPLLSAVPIKWLDKKFTQRTPQRFDLAIDVLSKLMQKYEVEEPNHLEEIILEKISGDYEQDSEYKPRINSVNNRLSKREFDRLLLDYHLRYDDDSVFKIPWDRYFVFADVAKGATIDGAYINFELVSLIFDIPIDSITSEWEAPTGIDSQQKRTTLKEFLQQNGSIELFDNKLYSIKALNAMHCQERFVYKDKYYSFSFDYADERNRDFEFNGEI